MNANKNKTSIMTKIALLSALAVILEIAGFSIPIFPVFLKFDFSDIPAIIGAIAFGPIGGIFIQLVKNVLVGIIASQSVGVGELANFLVGICLVIPIGLISKNKLSLSRYAIGGLLGIILMVVAAVFLNYFVLIPMYVAVMHFPLSAIVSMGNALNKNVIDLKSFLILCIVPYNIFKGVTVVVITGFLFKLLEKPLFRKSF